MITVIQLICILAFIVGWVLSGFALYQGADAHAVACGIFAIASYYAYSLSGSALPKPQP
jgi:hypothetical protein